MTPTTHSTIRNLITGKVSEAEMAEYDALLIVKPRHPSELEWLTIPLHERHAILEDRRARFGGQPVHRHVADRSTQA